VASGVSRSLAGASSIGLPLLCRTVLGGGNIRAEVLVRGVFFLLNYIHQKYLIQ